MAITRERAQAWLDSYVAAWKQYDERAIRDLFADGVVYQPHPFQAALNGRDTVTAWWLESKDEPNTYSADYKIVLVDGDRAIGEGRSYYFPANQPDKVEHEYANVFFLTFDTQGLCTEYREYYVRRADATIVS